MHEANKTLSHRQEEALDRATLDRSPSEPVFFLDAGATNLD